MAALAAFFISAALENWNSENISLPDTILTGALLFYIWQTIRRTAGSQDERPPASSSPEKKEEQATPEEAEEKVAEKTATPPFQPQNSESDAEEQTILHIPPWTIVEKGKILGNFRDNPIPSWIRTSDNRKAVYAGIAPDTLPDNCACLEIPSRGELIIPPGLIYAIRS
ncbi:MAG: hypothetical protein HQL52_12150 [Magnetococcales bacterium]|nr:hypothetical protein [Magnetococcales bacterium]